MAAKKYEPITKHLITMVEHNSELEKMLVKSIFKLEDIQRFFFARYLASPAQRTIDDQDDWRIVTAPADSTPQGVWKIDGDSNIVSNDKKYKLESRTRKNINTF